MCIRDRSTWAKEMGTAYTKSTESCSGARALKVEYDVPKNESVQQTNKTFSKHEKLILMNIAIEGTADCKDVRLFEIEYEHTYIPDRDAISFENVVIEGFKSVFDVLRIKNEKYLRFAQGKVEMDEVASLTPAQRGTFWIAEKGLTPEAEGRLLIFNTTTYDPSILYGKDCSRPFGANALDCKFKLNDLNVVNLELSELSSSINYGFTVISTDPAKAFLNLKDSLSTPPREPSKSREIEFLSTQSKLLAFEWGSNLPGRLRITRQSLFSSKTNYTITIFFSHSDLLEFKSGQAAKPGSLTLAVATKCGTHSYDSKAKLLTLLLSDKDCSVDISFTSNPDSLFGNNGGTETTQVNNSSNETMVRVVKVKMTLELDFDNFTKNTSATLDVRDNIIKYFNVSTTDLIEYSLSKGSVIVNFGVVASNRTDDASVKALEAKAQNLTTSKIFSNYTVVSASFTVEQVALKDIPGGKSENKKSSSGSKLGWIIAILILLAVLGGAGYLCFANQKKRSEDLEVTSGNAKTPGLELGAK
eukprot:TRINITY_DN12003_c0_g1_i2.p1 TRINITY_DN12003_c0_g1~~TRINITY_DN12003_c0_g1_i2.p1  ORF type:complete len:530 (+),score=122.95 TRINITY_DN12003_c0_g1_i2:63-1652(+)